MHENDDPLFDVVHSLPVLTYSVALTQRTPTAGYDQQTKYMPDYGGYLETTTSRLKNNALASGIPFNVRPERTRIELFTDQDEGTSDLLGKPTNNCLVVDSYLDSDTPDDLSVIRLLGSSATFHSLKRVSKEQYETLYYGCIPSKDKDPTGLKHTKTHRNDYLLVKFAKTITLYNLNRSYEFNDDEDNTQDDFTHERIVSIKDRSGYLVRDASLSPFNGNIIATASDNSNVHSVKLFDLSVSSRQSFQNIEWATLGNDSQATDACLLSKQLRGRVVRTFIPIRPTNWGTQQLDHIPTHLCNLLVTNEHKISLIDPRISCLTQDYIVKSELPSFYPIEYLRKTIFSNKNDYQLYSLTNVHLRVIDTRYPGVPVAQVGHMLESETYNSMQMQLVAHPDCCLETICCSSSSRLCFVTFDQTQFGSLVNPKSTHLPYHDTSLNENPAGGDLPAFGLAAITAQSSQSYEDMFSIFQLSSRGDLLLRSYTRADGQDIEQALARINLMPEEDQARPIESSRSTVPVRQAHELPDRVIVENEDPSTPDDLIDISDSSFLNEVENKLESKRAQEKYELMKNKLCQI